MSSNEPQDFSDWRQAFERRSGPVYAPTITGNWIRKSVSTTLNEIRKIPVIVEDNELLILNILVACWQAEHFRLGTFGRIREQRKQAEQAFSQLSQQALYAQQVRLFAAEHSEYLAEALKAANTTKDYSTDDATEDAETLLELIRQYERGLRRIEEYHHPAHIDPLLDHAHGPLLLNTSIRVNTKAGEKLSKLPDAQSTGLIFQLVYLFRYFTGQTHKVTSRARFQGKRLVIEGHMIDGGRPYYSHVATLVNAALNAKLTPEQVKYRLIDLKRDRSPPRLRATSHPQGPEVNLRPVEFIDWGIEPVLS